MAKYPELTEGQIAAEDADEFVKSLPLKDLRPFREKILANMSQILLTLSLLGGAFYIGRQLIENNTNRFLSYKIAVNNQISQLSSRPQALYPISAPAPSPFPLNN